MCENEKETVRKVKVQGVEVVEVDFKSSLNT